MTNNRIMLVYNLPNGAVIVRVSEDDVKRAKFWGRACGTPVAAVIRPKQTYKDA